MGHVTAFPSLKNTWYPGSLVIYRPLAQSVLAVFFVYLLFGGGSDGDNFDSKLHLTALALFFVFLLRGGDDHKYYESKLHVMEDSTGEESDSDADEAEEEGDCDIDQDADADTYTGDIMGGKLVAVDVIIDSYPWPDSCGG